MRSPAIRGTSATATVSAEQNPTHTFPRGTFNVTLTVTSDEPAPGNTDPETKPVTVNGKPLAAFTFNPANPLPDQPVLFASNSTDPDGDNLAHSWDFGDGSGPVTERNPAHAYITRRRDRPCGWRSATATVVSTTSRQR